MGLLYWKWSTTTLYYIIVTNYTLLYNSDHSIHKVSIPITVCDSIEETFSGVNLKITSCSLTINLDGVTDTNPF